MEALSLLRYWRSNGSDRATNANVSTTAGNTTTIVTGVSSQASETADEEDDENDHGPFFDLEFSLPEGDEEHEKNGETVNGSDNEEEEDDDDEDEDERELKFTLMSGSSGDSVADVNVAVSPSDDLFFRGSFVPVDQTTEVDSKPPQLRLSLMKSATKFRVMMLKFRKSKLNTESNVEEQKVEEEKEETDRNGESTDSGKAMTVKFKVEEVPIVSLFKRHNSSKPPKKQQNDNKSVEEKKFSKETMQKYFRKVKLSGEKLKFTGQLKFPRVTKPNVSPSLTTEEQKQSPAANPKRENESPPEVSEPPLLPTTAKLLKQGNLPAGLRVVCKHLGKSFSGATPVAVATATATSATAPPFTASSNRRDDSLLQQQDGIQSAILHCKRSFKASRDSDCSSSDAAVASGE